MTSWFGLVRRCRPPDYSLTNRHSFNGFPATSGADEYRHEPHAAQREKALMPHSSVSLGPGLELISPYGLAPLNSSLFGPDGSADGTCLDFYDTFITSGIGVLTLGGVAVSADGRANRTSLVLDQQHKAAGLGAVAERAHRHGVRLVVQLEHAGRQTSRGETGFDPLGPTAVPCPVVGGAPRAATARDLDDVIERFARAAEFAVAAGVDTVEIHAAHGYLISGFLSRHTNIRTDAYGGSVSHRFRLLRQIATEIHRRCGKRPGVRLNVYEHGGGTSPREIVEGLKDLSNVLLYVSVSGGMYSSDDVIIPARSKQRAIWRDEARELRRQLGVPVLLAGNIDSLALADELLGEGAADVVLFGRALLADPGLIAKTRLGRPVQPCTDCRLCKYHSHDLPHIYCPYHPTLQALGPPRRLRAARS
jgi:2,4-dienoyl-CoA reductase-like NADH-dependent reductase (Old Yellow Enzyme family)